MIKKWIKAAEGVRYREHAERKNGISFDRYYVIYFRQAGKQVEQAIGWGSKGVTLDFAKRTLAELKKNYVTASGPVTLKEKRQIKADAEAEQVRQKKIEEQVNVTFKAFFEYSYLPIQQTHKQKPSWLKEQTHATKWLFPVIGHLPIKDVTSFHIERIKKNILDAGRTPRTLQHILATCRQVWNHARRNGIVTGDSPTRAVKIPKFDNQRQRFLTDDECSRLLESLEKKCITTYRQAVISLDAGLRFSEIAGLQWQHIDTIRETILLTDTKSGRNRTVYMTKRLKDIFLNMEKGNPDSLVFPKPDGGQMIEVSRVYEKTVAELKLNQGIDDSRLKVVFHSLRHTHASRLLESGVDIYLVKTLLGHRNITTTERYSHIRADSLRNAIKTMEVDIEAKQATAKIIPMLKQS